MPTSSRKRRIAAFLALPASMLIALTACTSDSPDNETPTDGALPAVQGVEVTGAFGTTPVVEFTGDAGTELERTVLTEGKGDEVEAGDLIVVNYSGQVFGSDATFDSSFERPEPTAFPIGTGAVIPGWDAGMVGVTEGSRIVLSIPAEQAYPAEATAPVEDPTVTETPSETPSETGSSSSDAESATPQGATPSESSSGSPSEEPTEAVDDSDPTGKRLVFVVDVVGTYAPDEAAEADAKVEDIPTTTPGVTVLGADDTAEPAADAVTVKGAIGSEATITVGADAPVPTQDETLVLARGTGEDTVEGSTIVQYQAVTFDGAQNTSTWESGTPGQLTISDDIAIGVTGLTGYPVGSRLVLLVAPQAGDPDPRATATAVVIDIIDQVPANDIKADASE